MRRLSYRTSGTALLSLFFLLLLLTIGGCAEHPSEEEKQASGSLRSQLIPLYTAADHRQADSVMTFLHHENDVIREKAALALSSWEYLDGAEVLVDLYTDPIPSVRAAAYYASGQVECATCVEHLMNRLLEEEDPKAIRELYEGIGKVGRLIWDARLDSLSQANEAHREGAAWHLYRCTLRGDIGEGDLERAFELLKTGGDETRLGAAHFLGRSSDLDLTSATSELEQALESETNPDIRLGLISALRHLNPVFTRQIIEPLLNDSSLTVVERVNALRSYRSAGTLNADLVHEHLLHHSEQVRVTAAGLLNSLEAPAQGIGKLREKLKETYPEAAVLPVVESLFWSSAAQEQNPYAPEIISREINAESRSYHRAALVAGSREMQGMDELLTDWMLQDSAAIVRTTAAEMLIHRKENNLFKGDSLSWQTLLLAVFDTGDLTAMGMMADHITAHVESFTGVDKIESALEASLNDLTLPRDFESAVSLQRALSTLQGEEVREIKPHWNHPTDWKRWEKITSCTAQVSTSHGDVFIELDLEGAPTAALNFIELAETGYFNGKAFHRVVPNFVIQTGCPRGDGWGSTDYTLRSDFGPHRYRSGSVGMASLGADTESCQWFVCHSPTPHLEGRYTVFGHVTKGMEVVQQVSVGDRILDVSLSSHSNENGL